MIYDLDDIEKKLTRPHRNGDLYRYLMGKCGLFPFSVTLKRPTQKALRERFDAIVLAIETLKQRGYPLVFQKVAFRSMGEQSLPVEIRFEGFSDYVAAVGCADEAERFKRLYPLIVGRYEVLEGLIVQKPHIVLEYAKEWERLLAVCDYLNKENRPYLYIRQLDIEGVDTKYIQRHKKFIDLLMSTIAGTAPLGALADYAFERKYRLKYPQPTVRFRILDPKLYIEGIDDMSMTVERFALLEIPCQRVYIVENQITTLAFPDRAQSIVIFGQGYGISALREVGWLKEREVYYWGDIDPDGYAILSRLRGFLPHTRSILMDDETLRRYARLAVRAPRSKSYPEVLAHLTPDEQLVYARLLGDYYGTDVRLEQERIPMGELLRLTK